jgi:hypothetical protein
VLGRRGTEGVKAVAEREEEVERPRSLVIESAGVCSSS